MAEEDLVSLFAILLVLGSVVLLFAPVFYRLARSSLWALSFALAVPAFLLAALGYAFVEASFTHPGILAPVVVLVFGARVVSPTLAFFRVRDQWAEKAWWGSFRLLLVLGFSLFGIYLLLYGFSGESPGTDPILISERIIMALGTAFVFLRIYWKVLPSGSYNRLALWIAAILFSVAIAVVAPYAFPAYGVLYALSGLMGWFIGSAVAMKAPSGGAPQRHYTTRS